MKDNAQRAVDGALNSKVFVVDRKELAALAKGRKMFWGEIDQQHVLSSADPEVGRRAVRDDLQHFHDPKAGAVPDIRFI